MEHIYNVRPRQKRHWKGWHIIEMIFFAILSLLVSWFLFTPMNWPVGP